MCGYKDENNSVNESILSTSCSNAMKQCHSAYCVEQYVKDAFYDRFYKFCPTTHMNLLVTDSSWAGNGYGIGYHSGYPYDCIAYCENR